MRCTVYRAWATQINSDANQHPRLCRRNGGAGRQQRGRHLAFLPPHELRQHPPAGPLREQQVLRVFGRQARGVRPVGQALRDARGNERRQQVALAGREGPARVQVAGLQGRAWGVDAG
jgi:hypothetical protein